MAKMMEMKTRKSGGGVEDKKGKKSDFMAGADSETAKEAGFKRGGGVKKTKSHKHLGKMEGMKAHRHLGHRGRKAGGAVGADSKPMSSAGKLSAPSKPSEDN